MPTLYIRNLPVELYDQIKAWAEKSGRSVNAEVLDLLEREVERRREKSDWWRRFEAYRAKYPPLEGPPFPEDLIREDRDRGHKPDFGH